MNNEESAGVYKVFLDESYVNSKTATPISTPSIPFLHLTPHTTHPQLSTINPPPSTPIVHPQPPTPHPEALGLGTCLPGS